MPDDSAMRESLMETAFKAPDVSGYSGAQILDEAVTYIRRFVVFPRECYYYAVALWAAGTHVHTEFSTFPRLAFLAPLPASGKTRALEITLQLCARPRMELDPTGPAVANVINLDHPTLGIDETDTVWGKAGSSSAKQQLRAILNSGYKAGATMTRKQGASYVSTPVFGPVAFAGMGNLPETLMTRSVVVRMRPRRKNERTEPYFSRVHAPLGAMLGESVGQWAKTVAADLSGAWPDLPDGIQDRAAECCEPLCAVADAAGGHWPATAREALREIFLDVAAEAGPSPSQRVLSDVMAVWPGEDASASSRALSDALRALDDAPWSELWPPESGPRELASLMSAHGLAPVKVKVEGRALQGYRLAGVRAAHAAMAARDQETAEVSE
jgi:Protein of unknown function (DUF3631)